MKTHVTSQTAGILKSFPHLKTVHIGSTPAGQDSRNAAVTDLHNALPSIKVY
jgi:hypothetical protein